ncbi:hypothetical protein AVEN_239203-1, partial [Araneus ventricosus]
MKRQFAPVIPWGDFLVSNNIKESIDGNIELHWVRTHQVQLGNEHAYELAKNATVKDMIDYHFNRSCVQLRNDAKRNIILKRQERWDQSQKGRRTKMFFDWVNLIRVIGNFFLNQIYTGQGVFGEYQDVDECLLEAHNCDQATETCLNSIGGFQCLEKTFQRPDIPKVTCPVGYEFNQERRTCDDVDECLDGVCPRGFSCLNTKGSYRCVPANATADPILHPCPRGFQFHTASGRCI